MEPDTSARGAGRTAAIGTAITVWTFADAYVVGVAIVALSAWINWLIVFGVAAALLIVINVACCNWVNRQWDA